MSDTHYGTAPDEQTGGQIMTSLAIGTLMHTPAPSVSSTALLTEVVERLRQHRLTGMPVTDAENRVIGFVSERDCIHALLISSYHCEGDPAVSEVMQPAQCVSPHLSLVELAQRMSQTGQPRVYPVVENGVLVGLITRGQVLSALAENRLSCERPTRAA
jgi:CBS domain-containing protein